MDSPPLFLLSVESRELFAGNTVYPSHCSRSLQRKSFGVVLFVLATGGALGLALQDALLFEKSVGPGIHGIAGLVLFLGRQEPGEGVVVDSTKRQVAKVLLGHPVLRQKGLDLENQIEYEDYNNMQWDTGGRKNESKRGNR